MMSTFSRYGVIGNPINHSLSPQIHRQFASQFGHAIDYQKYLVESVNLADFMREFFATGGKGLNVTLPFKQSVSLLVDELSDEARLTGSVNTLWQKECGTMVGHSTDGAGFLLDLERKSFALQNKTILLVGAGGAAQPVLLALLQAGANVRLLNRTLAKAEALVAQNASFGQVTIWQENDPLDGVVSAVSEFNSVLMAPVAHCLSAHSFCYDLNYAERASEFLSFAKRAGCQRRSDGFGMLLGQAAESFRLWTGLRPNIDAVNLPKD